MKALDVKSCSKSATEVFVAGHLPERGGGLGPCAPDVDIEAVAGAGAGAGCKVSWVNACMPYFSCCYSLCLQAVTYFFQCSHAVKRPIGY